jgi:endonuclease G
MKPSGVALATAVLLLAGCGKPTMPPVPPGDLASPPCAETAPWGFPDLAAGAASGSSKKKKTPLGFLCRKGHYSIGYDASLRDPRWVAEIVLPEQWKGDPQRVRKDWRPDPFVPTSSRVVLKDYSKEVTQGVIGVKSLASHKNVAANEIMIGRTFYLSNTLPAFQKDKEPGAWERLEDQVVLWSGQKGKLLVISGPIFANGEPLGWTGVKAKQRRQADRGNIAIPTHFFKVVVDEEAKQGIAFIVPNDDAPATDLPTMAKKISDVERISGISFFPKLGETEKSVLLNETNPALWPIQ